jgi:hypothetical protein
MTNEDWTPEELERLRAARADAMPPRDLEDATVAALRHRGLVTRRLLARRRVVSAFNRKAVAATALLTIAAALVLAAGWSVMHKAGPVRPSSSPRFVLLLYAGAGPIAGAPDTRRQEYSQWARDMSSRGIAISGEELSEEARQVGSSAPAAGDLPRGFFVVSAADLETAEQIAATCPHLRYGGRIIVKRIVG